MDSRALTMISTVYTQVYTYDVLHLFFRYLTCLNNNPLKDPTKGVSDPLGKPFTMDEQCRYEFGENHISCRSVS